MESSVAAPPQDAEAVAAATEATAVAPSGGGAETSPAERQSGDRIFKFSRTLHVGPGAEECSDVNEETLVSVCSNPLHFHAWLRVPNQFQHNSIREKALAAKARRLRLLRDEDSDPRTILDGDLNEAVAHNWRDQLEAEIVQKDYVKDYWTAMREIMEEEEFSTYEEDRERYRALNDMPEENRPEEEFAELDKHLTAFANKVQESLKAIQQPLRDSLAEKPIEEVADIVREDRIQAEAHQAFEDTYSIWEWYIGTNKMFAETKPGYPQDRYYNDIEHLRAAASEIIAALSTAFEELDAEAGRALGNS